MRLGSVGVNEKTVKNAIKLDNGINGMWQRGILGATAVVQPVIDYNNKRADEDTRKYSTLRTTVAKVIVGPIVGVAVRFAVIKYTNRAIGKDFAAFSTKLASKAKKSIFSPIIKNKDGTEKLLINDEKQFKKYVSHVGTTLGVAVSLGTNFLIDMPLTKFLTNHFAEKYGLSGDKKETK